MLTSLEKILFFLLLAASFYYGGRRFYDVYRSIARGKPDGRFDQLPRRVINAVVNVLLQRSVFRTRPLVSFFHALVFYGFVFYFLVNLVDVLEGYLALHSRGGLWNAFNLTADVLTAAVLIGIIGLVIRRFFVRPKDFDFPANVPVREGVRKGIRRDSAIVSAFILFHVGSRLMYKASQLAVEGVDPWQPVSTAFAALFSGMAPGALEIFHHLFFIISFGGAL
jgi:hypothetical protein